MLEFSAYFITLISHYCWHYAIIRGHLLLLTSPAAGNTFGAALCGFLPRNTRQFFSRNDFQPNDKRRFRDRLRCISRR